MFKAELLALAGVAQWIECWPANRKVASLILVRAHAWVASQVPSWDCARDNRSMYLSHTVSLPLFLSPPSLKVNNILKQSY